MRSSNNSISSNDAEEKVKKSVSFDMTHKASMHPIRNSKPKLNHGATLLTKKTLKNYQAVTLMTKKEQYSQPQRVYLDVVSSDFGVPIIEQVPTTNGVYIPGQFSMTVHANISGLVKDKMLLESKIKQIVIWFSGCNTCWAVLILFNLFINVCDILNLNESQIFDLNDLSSDMNKTALIVGDLLFLLEYIIWLICIITIMYAISKIYLPFFRLYRIGMSLVILLECISRGIILLSYWQPKYNARKMSILTVWASNLICQYLFIHYAGILRMHIYEWFDKFS